MTIKENYIIKKDKRRALSLRMWPVPTIGSVTNRVLLCVDDDSFYINSQCFKLGLTLVRPIEHEN